MRQFTTSREEYITELKKGRDMLEETLEKRGAIVTALEQRLKEATEAASTQVPYHAIDFVAPSFFCCTD